MLKSKAQGDLIREVINVTANVPAKTLQNRFGMLQVLIERLMPTSTTDPFAKARLRGALAMRQLLTADGGAFSASEVAKLLGVSRQAVDKRRRAGQLLAVILPKRGLLYPAWRFGDGASTIPGFTEVLDVLRDHDPWSQARFFVAGNDRLGGKRPLDLLRKRRPIEPIVAAANAFDTQGAA
jgi:hypothetical protein